MLAVSLLRIWNETMAALLTTGYSLFHIEAQIVCGAVLLIILNHSLNTSTQTESQIYFVRLLFAQFLYCLTSVLRVFVNVGVISNSPLVGYVILALNFASMHFAAWLTFVFSEVSQDSWLLGSLRNKILTAIPLIIELTIFIFSPLSGATINFMSGSLKIGRLFYIMMTTAPLYYLAAAVLGFIRRSRMSRYEQDMTSAIWIYPASIFIVICLQAINWKMPLFCYAIMIADVSIYIQYADSLVSVDPLTKILNKNGLTLVLSDSIRKLNSIEQTKDIDKEEEKSKDLYVIAIDVDDLAFINSTYGRIDGDKVLVIIADALRKFADEAHECYIARYYGDEFMLVAEIQDKNELEIFVEHVRNYIGNIAISSKLPYHLRVNVGWAKYEKFSKLETVSGLLEEATKTLNENKEQRRFQNFWRGSSTQGVGI